MDLASVFLGILLTMRYKGIDRTELVYEGRDVELYFGSGDNAEGIIINELKNELINFDKKKLPELKNILKIRKIKISEYEHFGEWAKKLEFIL